MQKSPSAGCWRIADHYGKGISAYFGISHVGLGLLAYGRNDFETARRELNEGIRMGRLWNSTEIQLPGLNGLIQLHLAEGDLPAAEKALSDLVELSKAAPGTNALCEAWRAQIWLRKGQLAQAGAEHPSGGLVEPLSPRELELLRLLATEASNAEIAEQSYITVNTLKKHITNIYGKLGTANRLQAVQRARELKLL